MHTPADFFSELLQFSCDVSRSRALTELIRTPAAVNEDQKSRTNTNHDYELGESRLYGQIEFDSDWAARLSAAQDYQSSKAGLGLPSGEAKRAVEARPNPHRRAGDLSDLWTKAGRAWPADQGENRRGDRVPLLPRMPEGQGQSGPLGRDSRQFFQGAAHLSGDEARIA